MFIILSLDSLIILFVLFYVLFSFDDKIVFVGVSFDDVFEIFFIFDFFDERFFRFNVEIFL